MAHPDVTVYKATYYLSYTNNTGNSYGKLHNASISYSHKNVYLCRNMKKIAGKVFAVLLICVFVNFVFMNTVFVHTHLMADGSAVSHSHPYLPSSTHTHSAASLMSIAQFNAAATTMESTVCNAHVFCCNEWERAVVDNSLHCIKINVISETLRGPPAL